jgi:hypothetical protein
MVKVKQKFQVDKLGIEILYLYSALYDWLRLVVYIIVQCNLNWLSQMHLFD